MRDAETGWHGGSRRGEDLLRITIWIRLLKLTSNTVLYVGFEGFNMCGGLNICVGQKDREGADQILDRISV